MPPWCRQGRSRFTDWLAVHGRAFLLKSEQLNRFLSPQAFIGELGTESATHSQGFLATRHLSYSGDRSTTSFPFSRNKELSECLSAHDGYVIQASLCVSRLPLQYIEPPYEKQWREFSEKWLEETGNLLELPEELLSMGPAQFLESKNSKESKQEGALASEAKADASQLDLLLDLESQQLSLFKAKAAKKLPESKEVANSKRRKLSKEKSADYLSERTDEGTYSLGREPTQTIYLVVKYQKTWKFPQLSRFYGESMRSTLQRLCQEQLGEQFAPYLLGCCPFNVEKRKFKTGNSVITGRKIFYYRAHMIPGQNNVSLLSGGPIRDFAWLTRQELTKFVSPHTFAVVRPALYQTHLGLDIPLDK
ncbi:hypothetical protein IE077_003727 [Cardiosporidium cionae]|uniref:Ribosomal protein L46 N-terminal domain-containing protein n=1 Tax=Cardiosporidium cionae TaxID=476202 RepID=A0ABQ7J7N0_9APIC|nr:hypothetical protein IE077_003727 [Cardiosporidium cionae]|eukprot:KAF8819992.1 hypothetical protein IE077_003727 [Cardiosporidium cionae]